MPNIYCFSKQNSPFIIDAIASIKEFYNIEILKDDISLIKVLVNDIDIEALDKKLSNIQGFLKMYPVNKQTPLLSKNANIASHGFKYNGLSFGRDNLQIIAGLNAVDTKENVDKTFKMLQRLGLKCTRMGCYKPRTNPYSFQGLRKESLKYVFESASTYGCKAVAIEVLSESHVDEVLESIKDFNDTGVIFQIGTRNAQNFELLNYVGQQKEHPILYKRGFGISLEESMQACEYIAKAGNENIIFCFRGLKSFHAYPHRNLCDFSQIPVINRSMNVVTCADPSHSIGSIDLDSDDISDISHVTAQAVISGVHSLLIDIHPTPSLALVDKSQALDFVQLEKLINDIMICKSAFKNRVQNYASTTHSKVSDLHLA